MLIAIISDVHANLPALNTVLEDIEKRGIEKVFCCGDMLGYNPFVNEVAEIIKKRQIPCILGNHDHAVITGNTTWLNFAASEAIRWSMKHIKEENLAFIKSLPLYREIKLSSEIETGKTMPELLASSPLALLVHGSPRDALYEYVFPDYDDATLKSFAANYEILIMGHTHVPFKRKINTKLILNPGSVGQPRDGNNKASYAIVDVVKRDAEIIRLSYDIDAVAEEIIKQGLPRFLAERLYLGV